METISCDAITRKPESFVKPDRPKRGYYYFSLYEEMKRATIPGDPQKDRAYRWEDTVLGEMEDENVLGSVNHGVTKRDARIAAVAYLGHLWRMYSPRFSPYFSGLPSLRIGYHCVSVNSIYFARLGNGRGTQGRKRITAHANARTHSIYCPLSMLYRKTIVHEVCHLLVWRERHGPEFCAALIHLWEREFGIRPSRARWLALGHGVQVA